MIGLPEKVGLLIAWLQAHGVALLEAIIQVMREVDHQFVIWSDRISSNCSGKRDISLAVPTKSTDNSSLEFAGL